VVARERHGHGRGDSQTTEVRRCSWHDRRLGSEGGESGGRRRRGGQAHIASPTRQESTLDETGASLAAAITFGPSPTAEPTMLFRRLYDEQLAQASYLLGCPASGQAVVVDPGRHVEPYLRAAEAEGLRVSHVTETHIHADFVSGARELSRRAGARLLLSDAGGADWRYRYAEAEGAELLRDGSVFTAGAVELRALHTPGHTPEHLSFLVTDTSAATEPMGALTGDFVFVGDVGRPDLLERAVHMAGTMETGARQLFRSLQRFSRLPDYLQLWPGHGAGSACGKALGAVPQSTLGYERRFNWAFGLHDEDEFVRAVLAGQPDPPGYFARMKQLNQDGPPLLGPARTPARRGVTELEAALESGVPVVDARPWRAFAAGAVPGTLSIPANRSFTTWAGSLLPYDRDLLLVVDEPAGPGAEHLARRLEAIGLDRLAGYLGGDALDAWAARRGPLQVTPGVTRRELADALAADRVTVLDVRSTAEWAEGHLPHAINLPLGELEQRLEQVPRGRPIVVHCQSGARAAMAAALLRARGVADVSVYGGGYAEWRSEARASGGVPA
jgi:hydroxyacylglutathione hydrolase